MHNHNYLVTAVVTLCFVASVGIAEARNYTVAADLSQSSRMVGTKTKLNRQVDFAQRAGAYVRKKLLSLLKYGDTVSVRAFGTYGKNQTWRLDVVVSKRNRAYKVANAVGKIISSIPRLVEKGVLERDGATNIIGFLEDNSEALGCADGGHIYLLSDGIEASEYTNPRELVNGSATPPKPSGKALAGCKVEIVGIGHTVKFSSPRITKNVKRYWRIFSSKAGIEFKPVPSP